MRILFASLALVLTATVSAPADAGDEQAELRQLLDDFLAGASKNDGAMHDRFWAEDLVYTSSSGERFGKARIMNDLESSNSGTDETLPVYSAEDVGIRVFDNTAVITFRLVADLPEGDRQHYFNTGVFRMRNDQWKAVIWHATRSGDSGSP